MSEVRVLTNFKLLEEIDDIIYISDLETNEMIYINKSGRESIQDNDYIGKKCYKVLQGKDEPCSFCTNPQLVYDKSFVWEYENAHLGRHYIMKDKLIDLDGKPARFQLSIDITKKEIMSRSVTEKLEIEKKMIECIKIMTDNQNFEENITKVLEIIREFHNADRAYILETNTLNDKGYTLYDCKNKNWQKENIQEIINWKFSYFQDHDDIKVSNIINKQIPKKIQTLFLKNEVLSLISIPLKRNEQVFGFIGLDNPKKGLSENSLLNSMLFYFMAELEQRKIEKHLTFLVYHDEATGFFNRNYLIKTLMETNHDLVSQVGVICLKVVENPVFNFETSEAYVDENINSVTQLLKTQFPNERIYRASDDYFIILFFNKERDVFAEDCLNIKKMMLKHKKLHSSIGVIWSDRSIPVRDLIINANELLTIESASKNEENAFYNQKASIANVQRLCKSIAKGDFRVFLQPKFDASTSEVVGAEALIRYFHPKRGAIYPDQFIFSLERDFSIKYIDFFVLEEVCKHIKQWHDHGEKVVPISVNFSRITILEEDFLERVIEIVDRYGVDHRYIELEITETVDAMDRLLLITLTKRIKKANLSLSLDDFGSKYANLSLLACIELDVIKLDKSLIDDLAKIERSRLVLKGIIDFAKEIGVKTIAEGVESAEQLAILKELNCDYIQGYYFSRPISIEEYVKNYVRGETNENYAY